MSQEDFEEHSQPVALSEIINLKEPVRQNFERNGITTVDDLITFIKNGHSLMPFHNLGREAEKELIGLLTSSYLDRFDSEDLNNVHFSYKPDFLQIPEDERLERLSLPEGKVEILLKVGLISLTDIVEYLERGAPLNAIHGIGRNTEKQILVGLDNVGRIHVKNIDKFYKDYIEFWKEL